MMMDTHRRTHNVVSVYTLLFTVTFSYSYLLLLRTVTFYCSLSGRKVDVKFGCTRNKPMSIYLCKFNNTEALILDPYVAL